MTGTFEVLDYDTKPIRAYTVRVNCYWLYGAVTRKPQDDNWLDPLHDRVARALRELDSALLELCRAEGKPDSK
jgi:hypothetical protein